MKLTHKFVGVWLIATTFTNFAWADGFDKANDEALVLWMHFDEADPIDSSPEDIQFSSVIPGELVNGLVEKAWHFKEEAQLSIINGTFQAIFDESTFAVWISNSSDNGILYEEGGGTNGHCVQIVNKNLQFCTKDNGTASCVEAPFPTGDEDWHLVTTVFTKGDMRLYIDGQLIEEKKNVPGIGSHANETGIGNVGLPTVGTSCTSNTGHWEGVMDELMITRRTATAEEIKAEFDSSGIFAVQPSGKLAISWGEIKADRKRD